MDTSAKGPNDLFHNSMDFIKQLWSGLGVPGMEHMTAPTLSLEELDKRIKELKTVEAWLNINTTMLHNTIHGLEIQRATLATLHSFGAAMSQTSGVSSKENQHHEDTPKKNTHNEEKADDEAVKSSVDNKMYPFIEQSTLWWNTLEDQFKKALAMAVEKNEKTSESPHTQTAKNGKEDSLDMGDKNKDVSPRSPTKQAKKKATVTRKASRTSTKTAPRT